MYGPCAVVLVGGGDCLMGQPGPHEEISDWQMRAVCRGVDTSLFYSPDGERGRARAERERRAKELCRRCPVVAACRTYALAEEEPYGTWGGLSETERAHLAMRMPHLRRLRSG
jgi:WhiB family redox-sensing transcriptional regulator